MELQSSLFGPPDAYGDVAPKPPSVAGSPTSEAAAEAIRPHANAMRAKVLAYLLACQDGATDEEMQLGIPMQPSTQRPRRVELCESGQARDSGKTRKTASGRKATVWIATGDVRASIHEMMG